MTTAKSRMRVLLATTSVTALMAVGSAPLHAACVLVTGAGVGYTNPLATTIDCIDLDDATLTGNVVNNGTISPGLPIGIRAFNTTSILGSIFNTGAITAATGIALETASTVLGGVTNSGTITGESGISVGTVATFAGGIVNSGTIVGDSGNPIRSEAVAFSGGINNSGTISGGTYSLNITGFSTFAGGITNTGTITAPTSIGIFIGTGSNFSGGITNGGVLSSPSASLYIQAVSTFSGGIANSGTLAAGDRPINVLLVDTFSGGIHNSGTIAISDSQGSMVNVNTVSVFSGGITNTGTLAGTSGAGIAIGTIDTFTGNIVNSGIITTDYTAITLSGVTTFSGNIINSGTIGGGSQGISVSNGSTFAGAIVNSGTIAGTSSAINLFLAPNAMTINQTGGVIDGRIRLSPFADVLTVSGGAIDGNIEGQGLNIVNFALGGGSFTYAPAYSISAVEQINVNSGFVTLNGANAAASVAVNGGTLAVGNAANPGATLNAANGVTVGSGGTLMGFGTILADVGIQSGATLSPGGSIGTMNVTGNLAIANGSFYTVEVNAAGAADRTIATGTATIAGGTVQVVQQPGAYPASIQYTILTANGGVNGTFTGATSELAFFTPELTYDAFNVYLSLSRNGTYFASVARTANQRSVGQALDASPIGSELVQLLSTQTAAGARQAYDALSGEVHASVQGVLLDDSRYMRHAMLGRLRQSAYADGAEGGLAPLGFGGPVAYVPGGATLSASAADFPVGAIPEDVPVFPSRLTFWSQAVGAWETIDGNGNAAEAQRDFGGLFAGMDAHFGQASRIGIVGGYTQSQLSVDERLSSADVDSGHVGVYAATSLDGFNLRAGAAYAFHDLETSRAIVFPGLFETAQADYDGDTGQVFGEIGYGIALGHIAAEPFAGLAWVHTDTDDFAEDGGIAALNGTDEGVNAAYSTLGIRLATIVMLDDGTALIPRASAAWQHTFGDVEGTSALGFQSTGTDFSITGVPIARNAALVEAGVDLVVGSDARLGITYTGALAEDVQDHAVKGNLTWRF